MLNNRTSASSTAPALSNGMTFIRNMSGANVSVGQHASIGNAFVSGDFCNYRVMLISRPF